MSSNNKWNSVKKKSARLRGAALYSILRTERNDAKRKKKAISLENRIAKNKYKDNIE